MNATSDSNSVRAKAWTTLQRTLNGLLSPVIDVLDGIGITVHLTTQTVFWLFRKPFRVGQMLAMMEFVGVQSLFIVSLTGVFSGMVLALQMIHAMRMFQAESMVGGIVVVALTREIAPVFAGLMVTARVGSAIAAELGNMRVTEQIDAITTMSVSPVQYLLAPRMLACVTMMPLLYIVYTVIGSVGAYIVAVLWLHVDPGIFMQKIKQFSDPSDLYMGTIKAVVFGFIISSISCRHGFYATGGARGVGQATTRAVVQSAVSILIANYLITSVMTSV